MFGRQLVYVSLSLFHSLSQVNKNMSSGEKERKKGRKTVGGKGSNGDRRVILSMNVSKISHHLLNDLFLHSPLLTSEDYVGFLYMSTHFLSLVINLIQKCK